MNTEHELTSNELDAVSGGSLPLPGIVATILLDLVHDMFPPPRPPITANNGDGTGPLLPY
jgi:hypothetical protein